MIEAIGDRVAGESIVIFLAGEAFFLGRSNDHAVLCKGGGAVMIKS